VLAPEPVPALRMYAIRDSDRQRSQTSRNLHNETCRPAQ